MLDWCLTKSYQPDGAFKVSDLDDTQGDACRRPAVSSAKTGFGLTRISLIPKLFKERIEAKLKSMGLNDPALKEAYDTWHAMD